MSKQIDNGHLVSSHQVNSIPKNIKSELITIPSTSSPAWSGYFLLDLKEKNIILEGLKLQFQASAISGFTASSPYPNYSPATFWWTKIEIVMGGVVVDTIYPNEQFIINNLFADNDEERNIYDMAQGHYSTATANLAQRFTLASSASNYYVDLFTLFNQNNVPLLFQQTEIQLRVWTDAYTNVVQSSSLSGTAVSSLTACNLLAKVIRLPSDLAPKLTQEIVQYPHSYKYLDLKTQQFTLTSGITSSNLVLSALTGNVAMLFFTIRSAITGSSAYQYTPCYSFSLLNSGSTNIVGGVDVLSTLNLTLMNKDWVSTSFTLETVNGIVNNYGNVYSYCFANDWKTTYKTAQNTGSYKFQGNEQLKITFSSSTSSAYYVDVYALTHSVLKISANSVPIKTDDFS